MDPIDFSYATNIAIDLIQVSGPSTLDDTLQSPVTFTDRVGAIDIYISESTNVPEGTYVLQLTAKEGPSGIQASYNIELIFSNLCSTATLDASGQLGYSATYSYDADFTFNADFGLSEPTCTMQYTCEPTGG